MHQTLCGELATGGSDWALAAYKVPHPREDADPDILIPQGSQGGNRTYAYIGWRFEPLPVELQPPSPGEHTVTPEKARIIWLENSTFAAWGCTKCAWIIPNPDPRVSGKPPATVKDAFDKHECAKFPRIPLQEPGKEN
jgi:hypothetical protein